MFAQFFKGIWGNLSRQEFKKFGILAGVFFLVIGTYQMLKALKDPMFDLYVGVDWTPRAKILSIFFMALMILIYSKLLDIYKKQSVFYVVCSFYALIFLCFSVIMSHPQLLSKFLFPWIPGNSIGWAMYLLVESFGSIMPALFWGFVASVTTTESAKRGYALIVICTQLGAIMGPLSVFLLCSKLSGAIFFALGAAIILIIPTIITIFDRVVPAETITQTVPEVRGSTGFFEGLRLLLSRRYLMGVFVITTFYEIVCTILDFQKIKLVQSVFPSKADGGYAYLWIKGLEGTGYGVIAFAFGLFGTSFFMRKLGLKTCLVTFPSIIAAVVISTFLSYHFGFSPYYLMWIFLVSVVIIKGLNYSLNNPSREVLYIPTSKAVKFKAKGWIDAFGARLLKGSASTVTDALRGSLPLLLTVGTVLSLGLVGVWIMVALSTSNKFDELQKNGQTIE